MVFGKLGLGFVAGVTIPFFVNEMTYMTIANSFLRPHLAYRIEKSRMKKDQAVPTQMLDHYVKDVIGSFLLFFVAIGPVIYQSYFQNKAILEAMPKREEAGLIEDDKYTHMLKQIKNKQAEQGGATDAESKITFEEYEAFLKKIEQENRLDQMELTNPRSALY